MLSGTSGRAAALLKPLCIAGGLVAAFMGAADARTPVPQRHVPQRQAHKHPAPTQAFRPAAQSHEHTLYYYVRSHHFELNGHIYEGGSGQKQGYNNSALECKKEIGPIPRGAYPLTEREAPMFGLRAWRVGNTPCNRDGILVHSDYIGVKGRPQGETKGCAAVKAAQWEKFVKDMDAYKPTRIIVRP